ncbi:MinD-like ATPase involved in chromosome partitioning or flagellar assembly [Arthrobacter sp. PL16]|nr:MinD-like ATPase involved in chromosome partitioning or flagellar assembly [Arthrobacter sp. PL16]
MTQEQPAWIPESPVDESSRARRRRAAADSGPPRFVDRFAPEVTSQDEAAAFGGQHPDDDVDLTLQRVPTVAAPAAARPTEGAPTPAADRAPAGVPIFEPATGPVRISVTPPGPAVSTGNAPFHGTVQPTDADRIGAQPVLAQPVLAQSPAPVPAPASFGVSVHPEQQASRALPQGEVGAAEPGEIRMPEPAEVRTAEPAEVSAPVVSVAGPSAPTGLRPRDGRKSFLSAGTAVVPAETGLRGVLTRLGLRLAPSPAEVAVRADVAAVSRHWPGPRTIAVVNGKGGANKTPTTVMLAAVFARNGGAPVLAWDNNETRGTLGWRTEQGPHEATVLDLLPQTGALLAPSAQSALLARYVHHQTADKFDVLRSKPDVLATQQKVTSEDFDALHEVASKYFRLNLIDSGNDETAERWLRMIHHTDQLVIATTTLEEHAEAGALLLEALRARGGRYGELSERAVVIVSQSDKNGTQSQAQSIADGFGDLARRAVTIPFDVALLKGRIRFSALRPTTQRAWLAAAAAVSEGL